MLGFENVKKGKRLAYFKDYYLVPCLILLAMILMVISIIRVTVFREEEDINILVAAAQCDFSTEKYTMLENKILDNFDVDLNGNGKEKIAINDCIMISNEENAGFESAEQDRVAALKLSSVLEGSLCTIQIVDEDMYGLLLHEGMIERYENLRDYGLEGEGYIKVPLAETSLDIGMQDPLYITIRPKSTTRIKLELYDQHIEFFKKILNSR